MVGGVRRGTVIPLQYYDISVIMHLGRYIWILGIIYSYNVTLYDSWRSEFAWYNGVLPTSPISSPSTHLPPPTRIKYWPSVGTYTPLRLYYNNIIQRATVQSHQMLSLLLGEIFCQRFFRSDCLQPRRPRMCIRGAKK